MNGINISQDGLNPTPEQVTPPVYVQTPEDLQDTVEDKVVI